MVIFTWIFVFSSLIYGIVAFPMVMGLSQLKIANLTEFADSDESLSKKSNESLEDKLQKRRMDGVKLRIFRNLKSKESQQPETLLPDLISSGNLSNVAEEIKRNNPVGEEFFGMAQKIASQQRHKNIFWYGRKVGDLLQEHYEIEVNPMDSIVDIEPRLLEAFDYNTTVHHKRNDSRVLADPDLYYHYLKIEDLNKELLKESERLQSENQHLKEQREAEKKIIELEKLKLAEAHQKEESYKSEVEKILEKADKSRKELEIEKEQFYHDVKVQKENIEKERQKMLDEAQKKKAELLESRMEMVEKSQKQKREYEREKEDIIKEEEQKAKLTLKELDEVESNLKTIIHIRCSIFQRRSHRLRLQDRLISKSQNENLSKLQMFSGLKQIFDYEKAHCGGGLDGNGQLYKVWMQLWRTQVQNLKKITIFEKLKKISNL